MNTQPGISRAMAHAIAEAKGLGGGRLVRLQGGFWDAGGGGRGISFGTKTIEALIARQLASYTEWKEGRNGRFPIEITLTP